MDWEATITLCDVNEEMCEAWREHFQGTDVEVHHGSIFDAAVDAYVSPANSFGFMDGGLDLLYAQKWPELEAKVQRLISNHCDGELPIGCSAWIGEPPVVVSPTMRVPGPLPEDTVNPYLSTWSAIICCRELKIHSVAIPGIGTGVGAVPYDRCAFQMRKAYDAVFYPTRPKTWWEARDNHLELIGKPPKFRKAEVAGALDATMGLGPQ